MRARMQTLRSELDEQLGEVLTNEQMEELRQLRAQRREQGRRDGGRRGPPPSEG